MLPWLARYPLSREAVIFRDGLSRRFGIPFVPSEEPTMSGNLNSAARFESVVADNIEQELLMGRMACPFDLPPYHNLRVSPLSVVPKKDSGKF